MTAHQIIIALIFVFCIPSLILAMPSPAPKKIKSLSTVENQYAQIQKLLNDNEILIQYGGLWGKLSATVISKKAYYIIKFDLELATLKQKVESFYANCINRQKSAISFFKPKDNKAQSNFYENVSIIYHLLFIQKGKISPSNKEGNVKQLIEDKDIILIPLSDLKRFPLEVITGVKTYF